MIVIADSGSTKTEWCFVDGGKVRERLFSKGINPFFERDVDITQEVRGVFANCSAERDSISNIFFYGAGCTPKMCDVVKGAICNAFDRDVLVEVQSDLVGAARSLFKRDSGIACILGTGSNSALYDGNEIVDNVSPLGFILGDEGSGATLGRLFVGNLLKNQFDEEIKARFFEETNLSKEEIIERVYRQPFPNRFLASLSPFILKSIGNDKIRLLVANSFKEFFIKNIMQYPYREYKIGFVGSVAYNYSDVLVECANSLGIEIFNIVASPMNGLIDFHS